MKSWQEKQGDCKENKKNVLQGTFHNAKRILKTSYPGEDNIN